MSKDDSADWFGVAPPDLTLVTRSKGDNWVYTYLRAYYEDSSKQYGVNNLVYPGTAMPNVLVDQKNYSLADVMVDQKAYSLANVTGPVPTYSLSDLSLIHISEPTRPY